MSALHFEKKMDKKIFRTILGSILLLLCVGILTFILLFHIKEVEVVGNTRYTEKEIEKIALTGPFSTNSFLISRFKGNQKTNDIPFVNGIKIEMVANNKVRIIVNEKQVIGYVKYLDSHMYFDKDGLVVESAPAPAETGEEGGVQTIKPEEVQTIKGEPVEEEGTKEDKTTFHAAVTDVPLIEGLAIKKAVLNEILPVKDKQVFNTILGIARMVEKFQIQPDKVVFGGQDEIAMYYGEIRVSLGKDNLLEEKISRVAAILPKLTGKTGTLHLEDYAEGTTSIIFSEGVWEETGKAEESTQDSDADGQDKGAGEDSDGADTSETPGQDTNDPNSSEDSDQDTKGQSQDTGSPDQDTAEADDKEPEQ